MHAVGAAHNLLAASIDKPPLLGAALRGSIPEPSISAGFWTERPLLRSAVIGLGGRRQGVPRRPFRHNRASEVMAILCLASNFRTFTTDSTDSGGVHRRRRSGAGEGHRGFQRHDAASEGGGQTQPRPESGGHPGLRTRRPFANIAHGCSSVIATRMAMSLAEWTVTEAGFASPGAEKFFDITLPLWRVRPVRGGAGGHLPCPENHGGIRGKTCPTGSRGRGTGASQSGEAHREHPEVPCASGGWPEPLPRRHTEEMDVVTDRCRELGVPSAVVRGS